MWLLRQRIKKKKPTKPRHITSRGKYSGSGDQLTQSSGAANGSSCLLGSEQAVAMLAMHTQPSRAQAPCHASPDLTILIPKCRLENRRLIPLCIQRESKSSQSPQQPWLRFLHPPQSPSLWFRNHIGCAVLYTKLPTIMPAVKPPRARAVVTCCSSLPENPAYLYVWQNSGPEWWASIAWQTPPRLRRHQSLRGPLPQWSPLHLLENLLKSEEEQGCRTDDKTPRAPGTLPPGSEEHLPFFNGGVRENKPDGSSYTEGTDWPDQSGIDLFSPHKAISLEAAQECYCMGGGGSLGSCQGGGGGGEGRCWILPVWTYS